MVPFHAVTAEFERIGEDAFLAAHPEWALLISSSEAEGKPQSGLKRHASTERFRVEDIKRARETSLQVAWLELKSTNLTVGRGPACAVRIRHPMVSTLHLVLSPQRGGDEWRVADQGSSNGTNLNGESIPVGRSVPITNGDLLVLGPSVSVTLLSPEGLLERINRRLQLP